jgi:hypothetical protein
MHFLYRLKTDSVIVHKGDMGELETHYITMLVTGLQETAIKDLFQQKNWSCQLNGKFKHYDRLGNLFNTRCK